MFRAFVIASLLVAALAGCASKESTAAKSAVETLDAVLVPDALVSALHKMGGGHFHATALLRVEVSGKADPTEGKLASPAAITTTTDLWLDRQGNFRLLETNDQDGGRELVRVGRDIAVALRYGKLIKRTAEDAETTRFLAEAVGAPLMAWEIVRRQVEVKSATGSRYELGLGQRLAALPAGFPAGGGLQKWRGSIDVKSLGGRVGLSGAGAGRVPETFECKATFHATRDALPDVIPIEGEVAVSATVDQIGKVPDVTMPDAEALRVRQRTILEEKSLLSGIHSSVTLPPPPKKKAGP